MSIVLLVYLASIVRDVKFALVLLLLLGVPAFGTVITYQITENKKEMSSLPVKKFVAMFVVALLLAIGIPDERTIYILAGASIAQDIANSPKTAATLDKVYKIVDKKLEEQLSEGIDKATKKIEDKVEESVK